MASHTCEVCGGPVENTNASGWHRDKCCGCILDEAAFGSRPVAGCECDECEAARGEG